MEPSRTTPSYVLDGPLPLCKGYQQLTTAELAAVVALTVPAGSTMVVLQAEAGDVRWRGDGVNPSSTVGMLITDGNDILITSSITALAALKFIRTSAGAILNCSFY